MKKFLSFMAIALMVGVASPVFVSCSDSKDEPKEEVNLDKTAINTEIADCEAIAAAATTDDYPAEAISTFKTLVTTVKAALEAAKSQNQVDALLKQLQEGKATFLAAAFGAIPDSAVIAKWTFDTDATNQVSEGTYQWTAVCTEAPAIFGSKAKPTFVDGISGKAVNLADGAHLQVSDFSEAAIQPKDFSISVWVKTSKTYSNNYIISYYFWNMWKLQVQDLNKPFFTFNGNQGICDADNELDQSVKEGEWTMITCVLSYTSHTLSFYVNGELTKTWDAEGKPALASTGWGSYTSPVGPLPIFIGISTDEKMAATWDWEWNAESLGAFYGAIDNLALYNVALTAGQVKKLYKDKN